MRPRLPLGIAASNLGNDRNPGFPLPQALDRLAALLAPRLGLELRLEGDALDEVAAPRVRPAFLGLHQPLRGIDWLDPSRQEASFDRLAAYLRAAHRLGADYVVLHLQTRDEWDALGRRAELAQAALTRLERLAGVHRARGYRFPLLVENLEFPKYPATRAEVAEVVAHLRARADRPLGLALDVGHLWHSGLLIRENLPRGTVDAWADEWARDAVPFPAYLAATVAAAGGELRVVHLTGCRGHETHRLPDATARAAGPEELDVPGAVAVLAAAVWPAAPPALVNEAMWYPYEAMIESCAAVARLAAGPARP